MLLVRIVIIKNIFVLYEISLIIYSFTVLPRSGPRISGGRSTYHVGDHVSVNCTSERSKPAAALEWLINGKAVSKFPRDRKKLPKYYICLFHLKLLKFHSTLRV